jgi:hypothetical protein
MILRRQCSDSSPPLRGLFSNARAAAGVLEKGSGPLWCFTAGCQLQLD